MAGESDTVKATINGGRPEARYEPSSIDPTADALLKDSVWSMASAGLGFQSQAGDISNGLPTRREGEPSQPDFRPSGTLKYDPITRFGSPSKIINEAIAAPVEKPQEPSVPVKDAEFIGPTVEQRQKFVEQLEQLTKEQSYRSNIDLLGMGTTVAGLALLRSSAPLALTVAALGIGTSLYNGLKAESAHGSARDLLKQMPKGDSERFGKYENDVSRARDSTARGYIMGGGVALISMSKITPYVNPSTTGAFLLGTIANNVYQTQYSIPQTLSTFRSDVETWKQEQTKK